MRELTPEKCKDIFFQHQDLIEKLAQRRFPDVSLADEAREYVEEALQTDGWSLIRKFKGKAEISTFLRVVVRNLLTSFSRKKFGRVRPPGWVKARGSLWMKIFQLLCVERMRIDDVIGLVTSSAPGRRSEPIVAQAIDSILERRPDCAQPEAHTVPLDPEYSPEEAGGEIPFSGRSPEDLVAAVEKAFILEAVSNEGFGENPSDVPPDLPGKADERIFKFAVKLRAQFNLTAQQRLFLKLIYQEGLTKSAAGELLGWNADQAHSHHRRLLESLRKRFAEAGLDDELKILLHECPES